MISGWTMLGVGMLTVFVVLFLVVLSGKLLIQATNAFNAGLNTNPNLSNSIPEHIHSLAQKIVLQETRGKGRIDKIEPLKPSEHG